MVFQNLPQQSLGYGSILAVRCPLTSRGPPGMMLSSRGGLRATVVRTRPPLRGQFGITPLCTGPRRKEIRRCPNHCAHASGESSARLC